MSFRLFHDRDRISHDKRSQEQIRFFTRVEMYVAHLLCTLKKRSIYLLIVWVFLLLTLNSFQFHS